MSDHRPPRPGLAAHRGPGLRGALLLLVVLASSPSARASDPVFEARTYLDLSLVRPLLPKADPTLTLGPFVREESRFRDEGLVLLKSSAGLRATLRPWLRAALYYAHQDQLATGRRQTHLASLDVFAHAALGPVVIGDKSGFEAHASDRFFRYRNALEVKWTPTGAPLSPFVNAELRVDSDSARVELYDVWVGLEIRPPVALSLRVFYGLEGNRRGKPAWGTLHMLGVALNAKL
ncbi:MAG: hypothetical protein CVU56_06120 [Deltaproteobacteria bacterium HGW-Deltaproteobacteria-14]|jgi:hypothetical protein|nr:MAG: hypothetical protein CVU56_06120 [Deltaproteobacteria bacterium HGW-Deltaproteobacteria-14]